MYIGRQCSNDKWKCVYLIMTFEMSMKLDMPFSNGTCKKDVDEALRVLFSTYLFPIKKIEILVFF